MVANATVHLDAAPLHELDVVRLRSAIYLDGKAVPVGAIGTIVFQHDGADAYEVEFVGPLAAVVTLRGSDLLRVG